MNDASVKPTPVQHETWRDKLARVGRSSLVGIVATILDFAVLELFHRVLGIRGTIAKLFSLTAGVTTQFIGSRYFAFRAQKGKLQRQLGWFVFVEFLVFWLTVLIFHGLHAKLHLGIELANIASGAIAYWGVSYPIWHWIFRVRPEDLNNNSDSESQVPYR